MLRPKSLIQKEQGSFVEEDPELLEDSFEQKEEPPPIENTDPRWAFE